MTRSVLTGIAMLAAALMAASAAQAAIIDDFSTAQGPVVGFNTSAQVGSMLGGERDVVVLTGGTLSVAGGVASVAGGSGGLIYDGPDGNAGLASYGLGGVDLTDGGLADRFWLEITSITGSVDMRMDVYASSTDGLVSLISVSSTGLVSVPFASLSAAGAGADLASALQVNLGFSNIGSSEAISFDNFCTGDANGCVGGDTPAVPEPSTWLLLAGGLALAALKRRRA